MICAFDGCGRAVITRTSGLCGAHLAQQNRGIALQPIARRKALPECTFPGCARPHYGKGLCRPHLRQMNSGADLRPLRPKGEMLAEHWRNLDPEERERRLAGLNRGTYVRDEEWRDRASLAATAWWRGKDRPAFKDKVCRGCDRAFTPNSGVQVYCTPACRDQNAQPAKYGITAATASKMLERQGGGCGICGRVPQLHIDHDHATGKVRGLLCVSCNTALGKFDESIERLQAAIDYLRRASV